MVSTVAPIAALLLSVALLLMGNGLQGTLLPVRANIESFPALAIGLIGTFYYLGFGLGCYFGGRLVRRAGHIRVFSAMASLASAIAIIHALFPTPIVWWGIRAIAGFCFAVLYVVIESWLNERSDNENRGRILSIYQMINLSMITVGQMMITLYDPGSFPLFTIASVLISLAVIPLALTTALPPAPVETVRLRFKYLYGISPVGCVGAFVVGLANGAFWALGPVFAQARGLDITGVAFFMSITVLAGAAGQWPLGRLSDRHDRRHVIAAACVIGVASGVVLALFKHPSEWMVLSIVAVFGCVTLPLFALCVAHMNDYVARDEFVEASSVMLLLFAAGAALGAVPASMLMETFGPRGLFAFTAASHFALGAFAIFRARYRTAVEIGDKAPFVGVSRTSPTVFALDPRSDIQPQADEEEPRGTEAGNARPGSAADGGTS